MKEMADNAKEDVCALIEKITRHGVSEDEVKDVYKIWAQTYDADLSQITYNPPRQMAAKVTQVLGENKSALLLDAAAGTGLVGVEMSNQGFTNLHALDASAEMLQKAEEKRCYDKLICCFLGGGHTLPIANDTYDGIVITGALTPGHVTGDCYEELIRVTKPGGVIILGLREKYLEDTIYCDKVIAPIYSLSKSGSWHLKERQVVENYLYQENGIYFTLVKTI